MMLLELPEEILVDIIRRSDIHSKINLYGVCSALKKLVSLYGGLKRLDVSRSSLSTIATLQTHFFKDVACQIQELNLSSVPNMCKSQLLPVLRKLPNLKSLNVSYTAIKILDLIYLPESAPLLRSLSINFVFCHQKEFKFTLKMLLDCKQVFNNLTEVEFVGSPSNLLYSQLPFFILQDCHLNILKFTVVKCQHPTYINEIRNKFPFSNFPISENIKQFQMFVPHWKEYNIYYGMLQDVPTLRFFSPEDYEYVVIKRINYCICKVYVTHAFQGFFNKHFGVEDELITIFGEEHLSGNIAIFLWNKNFIKFNEEFYAKFHEKVKCYFPIIKHKLDDGQNGTVYPSDWHCFTIRSLPTLVEMEKIWDEEPLFKKKRTGPSPYILDYDDYFEQYNKIQITLEFKQPLPFKITLSPSSNYLKKITYLSVRGVSITVDFFKVLFSCCDNLLTINVETDLGPEHSLLLSKYVTKSKNLKNLRLVDKRIQLELLFKNLSKHKLLENVHIVDRYTETLPLGDISCIVTGCVKMYSLYLQAALSKSAIMKTLRALNKAKAKCHMSYLNVELQPPGSGDTSFSYDLFIDVFQINPIKPI